MSTTKVKACAIHATDHHATRTREAISHRLQILEGQVRVLKALKGISVYHIVPYVPSWLGVEIALDVAGTCK